MIQKTYGKVDTCFRTYDEHGNITSDKHIYHDGTEVTSEWKYRYDEYGNIVYKEITEENGKKVEKTVYDNIQADGTGFRYDKKTVNTTSTSKEGSVIYARSDDPASYINRKSERVTFDDEVRIIPVWLKIVILIKWK